MEKAIESHLHHWRVIIFTVMVALTAFATASHATYSLPTDRSYPWAGNVGVVGDIPNRTTIYTTLSPSGGDDTSAIKSAISNCPSGQVILLKSGTFTISSPVVIKSGITLRGAGMGSTIVKGASGMGGAYLIGFSNGAGYGTSYSISAGMSKGSTTITTSSAHGWSVGDVIQIDQLNNASGNPVVTNVGNNGTCSWCGRASGTRSLGMLNRVAAVPSSTTATLEIQLSWNFSASQSPQATKINGTTSDAGIESLTVDNSASGSSSQTSDGCTIAMYGTNNCWLLRVEAIGSYETMVRVKQAYRNTVRGCKFHEGVPALPINGTSYATSRAYGIWIGPGSGNLFENNQLYHLFMPHKLDGPTSANVFAYNYITQLYYTNTNWNLGVFEFHGAHPSMNLFEGNYGDGRILADDVWGSSSHNTFFRNRQTLTPNKTGAGWDMDLQKNAQYYNAIGNVMGSGVESLYEANNMTLSGQLAIFRLGYTGDGDGDASGNDSQVAATLLLHGNWDSVNKTVMYNGSNDTVLPPSLYLTGKPAWWGTMQWPAIGPDVSPMYPTAPGAGNGTPWGDNANGTSNATPSAPTALAVQ
ncbi:glycoside hydrolase family 55 protein [Geomonas sp. Red32]|uniref:glycoside hydrolase family 55 protein n=1 Tax=Geomonas sp. Red32 TaxID=2912856 RepID=UPI00202CFE7E|nr:glycoside hydrolase family 55 protein [Geomonas sp. Red32]MCM0082098.1 glycoside hydrolase family 55 protein [Geomonas sp. Red32]